MIHYLRALAARLRGLFGDCGRRIRITARFPAYKTACAYLGSHPRRDESDGGNYD